jgi:hypothetical protein
MEKYSPKRSYVMIRLVSNWTALGLLVLIAACGGDATPPLPFAVADGGARVDGGAASVDAGTPVAMDAGSAPALECPPPDGGTPANNVVVLNPLTGAIAKTFDLTCHAENPGYPRPYLMALVQGKLYVTLQDFDAFFSNHKNGKVLVIDPMRDAVLRKVDLAGKKNISDVVGGPDGLVYVAAQGILGLDFPGFTVEPELSGGIDVVDPATDRVVRSIDDDAFGGNVTKLAFASATRAYAVVAVYDRTVTPHENRYVVRRFNPVTGAVEPTPVYAASGSFVSGMVFDASTGHLYVADADFITPRAVAIRDSDATVDSSRSVALSLTPQGMDLFVSGPARRLVLVEPDFSGGVGAVEVVDLTRTPPLVAALGPDPVSSDPVVRIAPIPGVVPQVPQAYVVNRFGADNIQWLDPESGFATRTLSGVRAQWSTGNGSNPQDALPVSATKLYVTLQN